ncbi:LacI family DNA-binding transcriptional regulator [Curvibacter lanceolatus]|uniref:LacI family DNA-binding transcriptional regulator n=1 Tax=Curvibacter lanceolatus TaxID=86182 RepID=UPI00037552B9|nr:LacI family DNA-binding transcriptional regulator [Curvibacter lanceolatus]
MLRSPARQRATGRVTLADVALAAGVSPITVSRALRGERAVDPVLVERVQAAAQKLGYVPDPAARALASKRSTHVAVLIPMLSNELFVSLLEAAQARLRAAGYQTLIGITHYDPSEEEQLLREQLMHRPAGLLVTGFDRTEATRRLIMQSGVPVVHMMENSRVEGIHSVGFSQTEAAITMTRHLLDRGYRRIAFAAAQLDPRTLQRQQGWRQALEAAGLYDPALEWMNPAPSSMALGGRLFQQIMGQSPAVDAVFFCNDDLAQGALLAANRLQLPVPARVAIAGFNDLTGSDLMLPTLSTVHTPLATIGDEAAGMLLKLMRGEPVEHPCVVLDYRLVVRMST